MEISFQLLNGNTPVFRVNADPSGVTARVWGAVQLGAAWVAPAYYPFGLWVAQDLATVAPQAVWDDAARTQRLTLQAQDRSWRDLEADWKAGGDPHVDAPADFFPPDFTPYSHQRYGMLRVFHWARSWFLWEMRTGKTRTILDGLRLLERAGQFKKALILGPPVVLTSWRAETARTTRGAWKAVVWDGSDAAIAQAQNAQIVLASYARVRLEALIEVPHPQFGQVKICAPEASRLRTLGYDVIVADESHNLGNWASDQTRAAIELSKLAARRYCLTGTAGDDPRKLYGQLFFLAPGLVPLSAEKFEQKHVAFSARNPHLITEFKHLNELNALVDSVATRLKRADCLTMPPRQTVDVPFDLGPQQRARYNQLVEEIGAVDLFGTGTDLLKIPHGATRLLKLRQILSGFLRLGVDESICDSCPQMERCVEAKIRPYTRKCEVVQSKPPSKVLRDFENPKLELFTNLLEQILREDPTNKVIVWGVFDEELDDIGKVAQQFKTGWVRLDGEVTSRHAELDARLTRFRDDPTCRVLVGMMSSGIGIDLSAANYMIFYSLDWDPRVIQQAEDRSMGPRQTRPVTTYRLVTPEGTPAVDRLMLHLLKFKGRVTYSMVERIACASCERQPGCALDGTQPFRQNCRYSASLLRPVAKVSTL